MDLLKIKNAILNSDHKNQTALQYAADIIGDYQPVDRETINEAINEQEIIYYGNAMEYLCENDSSLIESIGIAISLGIEIDKLNSETLATLHLHDALHEIFNEVLSC